MFRINYRIFLTSILSFVFFFSFFQSSQAGFFDWFKKNDSQSSQSITAVASSAKQYTLSVSKSGSGVVISDDGKINCGKQCKASYPANSKIVLKAEAGNNYKFERWNGCDKVLDGKCQTTLNKSKMIVVKFDSKRTNSFSSQKSSSLSARKASSSKYSSSKSPSASSKAYSSKSFSSSKSNSSVPSKQTQNYKTLTIKNVFYNKGKGVVKIGDKTCDVSQCVFEYDLNKGLELLAEAESGSVLSDWGYDCDYVFAPNNTCSLIMNDDKTVIVHFEPYFSASSSSKSSSSSSSTSLSFGFSSSLSANNQYYLKITSPNGGEGWKKGSRQPIKFATNKFDRFITLKLYKNNNYLRDIGYYDIAYSNPFKNSENIYYWIVPSSLNDGEDYKIYATITNSKELYGYEISGTSDSYFTIGAGNPNDPSVSVAVVFTYSGDKKLSDGVIDVLCDESKNLINDADSFFSIPAWYKKEALKYNINFKLNLNCVKTQVEISDYQLKNQEDLAKFLRKNFANLAGYDYLAIVNYTPSTGYTIGAHADGLDRFSMFIISHTWGDSYNPESKNDFSRIFAHELAHLLGASDKYLVTGGSCSVNPENGKQYDNYDIMCGIVSGGLVIKDAIISDPTAKEMKWK